MTTRKEALANERQKFEAAVGTTRIRGCVFREDCRYWNCGDRYDDPEVDYVNLFWRVWLQRALMDPTVEHREAIEAVLAEPNIVKWDGTSPQYWVR